MGCYQDQSQWHSDTSPLRHKDYSWPSIENWHTCWDSLHRLGWFKLLAWSSTAQLYCDRVRQYTKTVHSCRGTYCSLDCPSQLTGRSNLSGSILARPENITIHLPSHSCSFALMFELSFSAMIPSPSSPFVFLVGSSLHCLLLYLFWHQILLWLLLWFLMMDGGKWVNIEIGEHDGDHESWGAWEDLLK